MRIEPARFPEDAEVVRVLFRAYLDELGLDLAFQGVEAELAGLPGKYAPPMGAVLLARDDGRAVGVVAMWQLAPGIAEMKRLYIAPEGRGQRLGHRLVAAIIAAARAAGHARMRLDTLATMAPAQAAYRAAGFRRIGSYNDNPLPGARHYELVL